MGAKLDFDMLQKAYFQWDKPVDYHLNDSQTLLIYPIMLQDSELFFLSCDMISIDKDKMPDPDIISMSYLDFILEYYVLNEEAPIFRDKFAILMKLCLHWDRFEIKAFDNGKHWLENSDGTRINGKQFNDIKRIILYQNIIGYDDGYINPELKEAMAETDALKSHGITFPNTERRMAIITAHTGISKKQQMEMTYRSHCMLFNEVSGEADFIASWAIILYSGEAKNHEHWIYKKIKGKFDGYITNRDDFTKKLGANPNDIKQVSSDNALDDMFNNFNK